MRIVYDIDKHSSHSHINCFVKLIDAKTVCVRMQSTQDVEPISKVTHLNPL